MSECRGWRIEPDCQTLFTLSNIKKKGKEKHHKTEMGSYPREGITADFLKFKVVLIFASEICSRLRSTINSC